MCRLLETIACKNGELQNLTFHQERFDKARKALFGAEQLLSLAGNIQIPAMVKNGLFRCRVIYTEQIECIEFLPYERREITSLKLVEDNEIDYQFKLANREKLNFLFDQRGFCDDIMIVKNGLLTDSFAANLVFWDGQKWWTPDLPLLRGTQRAKLLKGGHIFERRIVLNDLQHFEKVGLINAFNNLDEMPLIDISAIKS